MGLREAYYSDYRGTSQELLSAVKAWLPVPGPVFQLAEETSWNAGARPATVPVRPLPREPRSGRELGHRTKAQRVVRARAAPRADRAAAARACDAAPLPGPGNRRDDTLSLFCRSSGRARAERAPGAAAVSESVPATGRRWQGNAVDRSNRARDVRTVQAPARIDRAGSAVRPAAQRPASAASRGFHHCPAGGRRARRRDAWRTGDARPLLWSCRRRPTARHQSRQRFRRDRVQRAACGSANERVLEDIVVERRSVLWWERHAAVAGRPLACPGPVRAAARSQSVPVSDSPSDKDDRRTPCG